MGEVTQLVGTLFSEDFFLRFGLVLFVLDNLILFAYVYRIQSYETLEEAKKVKAFYWKQLAWKSGYLLFMLWIILSDGPWCFYKMPYWAALYYVYALLVITIFIMYLVRNLVWYLWPNSMPKSVMPPADSPKVDSQKQAKGRAGDVLGLLKERGVWRLLPFAITISLVNVGIIFLVSGGLDKYFGVNKTADYHDLGKIMDAAFSVFWLLIVGTFVILVLYGAVTVMFGRHSALADEPSPTNQDAAPQTPAAPPAPNQPTDPKP